MKRFLTEKEYIIAPFKIESYDWMYRTVYEHCIRKKEIKKAKEIGQAYIIKSLESFDLFQTLAREGYNRPINQICLCHHNKLNAGFLPKLITEFKEKGSIFINLEHAITNDVYQQKDTYFKKWGGLNYTIGKQRKRKGLKT